MDPAIDKLYNFASLDGVPFSRRFSIYLWDLIGYMLINAIGRTVKLTTIGEENHQAVFDAGKQPVYSLWHNRLFLCTYFMRDRGVAVLTSKSFDGHYISRFIQRFGFGAIRGSSSSGGSRALVEMIRTMKRGVAMGFTIDGPRGPKYQVKAGPVILAKKTGNPILPMILESGSYWSLSTWDNMQIPRPFSRALMVFAEPIYVPADADDAVIEEKRREFQSVMDVLTQQGEQWRLGQAQARAKERPQQPSHN
ncbi:MAG: lysophospholipid acyltransferase family protein [Acidobacteria bacterium]|nr:lysophospholipid acyltransferase family protein [Acidobacteriota bacterium]